MRLLIAVALLLQGILYAQETTNALHYNYSSVYNSISASLTRHEAGFEHETKNLKLAAGVAAYGIDYNKENLDIDTQNIGSVTAIYASVAYTHTLTNNWSINAEFIPKVVSDLENTGIRDVYPGFFAGFTYKRSPEKSTTLTFGAGYNGYFGKYRFMPVVNYSDRLGKRVAINIGIPATWISYEFSETHSLRAMAATDGFYSRIGWETTGTSLYGNSQATVKALEMVNINTGLEYRYNAGKEWTAKVRAGYSIYNKLEIPDGGSTTEIGFKNNLYMSAGFIYNLKL